MDPAHHRARGQAVAELCKGAGTRRLLDDPLFQTTEIRRAPPSELAAISIRFSSPTPGPNCAQAPAPSEITFGLLVRPADVPHDHQAFSTARVGSKRCPTCRARSPPRAAFLRARASTARSGPGTWPVTTDERLADLVTGPYESIGCAPPGRWGRLNDSCSLPRLVGKLIWRLPSSPTGPLASPGQAQASGETFSQL